MANPLEQWAETVEERAAIEAFLDWAAGQGLADIRFAYTRSDILDRYHEIDRRALEQARRALLQTTTNAAEAAFPGGTPMSYEKTQTETLTPNSQPSPAPSGNPGNETTTRTTTETSKPSTGDTGAGGGDGGNKGE